MAKIKTQTTVLENRLDGKSALVEVRPHNGRALYVVKQKEVEAVPKGKKQTESKPPITTSEAEGVKKAEKQVEKQKAKTAEKTKATELTDVQQKVLAFLQELDHPATSNEVRDKFGFPLRGNARAIFRKLDSLGYGNMRKTGKKWLFYVKGKEYPKPQESEPKKSEAKAESKSAKA